MWSRAGHARFIADLVGQKDSQIIQTWLALDPDQVLVDRALQRLPARVRLVLDLHYGAGRSWADIARTLELPPDRVYQLKSRAFRILRSAHMLRPFLEPSGPMVTVRRLAKEVGA